MKNQETPWTPEPWSAPRGGFAVYCDACLDHAPPGTPEATPEDAVKAGACAWCGWPLLAEEPTSAGHTNPKD